MNEQRVATSPMAEPKDKGSAKPKRPAVRQCLRCGTRYPVVREWQKYCSDNCRWLAWKDKSMKQTNRGSSNEQSIMRQTERTTAIR